MRKILLAVNPLHPGRHAIDFAAYLGRFTRSKVTAISLEYSPYLERATNTSVLRPVKDMELSDEIDVEKVIKENISSLKEAFAARDTGLYVHRDRTAPVAALIKESRFADALVIDPATSFKEIADKSVSDLTRKLLAGSECPVILSPASFEGIDQLIFIYDGSNACMQAFKQFTNLFPGYSNKMVTVIQSNDLGEWRCHETHHLKEWMQTRYSNIHFAAVKGESMSGLPKYLGGKDNLFIITGAYTHSSIAALFRLQIAEMLVKCTSHAVFVANR